MTDKTQPGQRASEGRGAADRLLVITAFTLRFDASHEQVVRRCDAVRSGAALRQLVTYPLKSGAGIGAAHAEVTRRGLQDDRRWMVVDAQGDFLTARRIGRLLSVRAEPLEGGALRLSAPDHLSPLVASPDLDRAPIQVTVWKDRCAAHDLGDASADWMSHLLGQPCRVVWMPEATQRAVSGTQAHPRDIVSFADGFPILLTTEESLRAVSDGLAEPVPMACFRPNIVIAGYEAFAERSWSSVRIGALEFDVAGPCVRCQMTVRHPATGVRRTDGQPLARLAELQATPEGVVFGVNLIPRQLGTIRVGDPVLVS